MPSAFATCLNICSMFNRPPSVPCICNRTCNYERAIVATGRTRKYLYYHKCQYTLHTNSIGTAHLTQIQRMRETRRKTTCTPPEPKWIMYRRVLHIVALPQLCTAHLLLQGRHVELQSRRSCM